MKCERSSCQLGHRCCNDNDYENDDDNDDDENCSFRQQAATAIVKRKRGGFLFCFFALCAETIRCAARNRVCSDNFCSRQFLLVQNIKSPSSKFCSLRFQTQAAVLWRGTKITIIFSKARFERFFFVSKNVPQIVFFSRSYRRLGRRKVELALSIHTKRVQYRLKINNWRRVCNSHTSSKCKNATKLEESFYFNNSICL